MRSSERPCRGPNRRDLLRIGILSAWGLGLEDLLRLRAHARDEAANSPPATSCILVWLAGGPAHLDTFDPKPQAPADVRGEFQAIDTAVPGVQLTEVFPKMAATLDRWTLIRSMTSPEADHDRAAHHLLTGYRPSPALVYPSYGSVVARVRRSDHRVLPPYVAVPDAPLFSSSGYLTPAFDPFAVNGDPSQPNFRVRDLTPPDRLTLSRMLRRREMVRRLDRFEPGVSETALTASRDRFSDQAYDLMTSGAARAAFQIADEPDAVRDAYGRTPLGQGLLLARRLIDAGVAFVTVNDRGAAQLGWDTHQQNFPTIRSTLGPPLDQGLSALVDDLSRRGTLGRTLVVVMGEFGRTPKINGNAGRDHHGRANSVLLAGGGLPGGVVIGKTDAQGDAPVDRPVSPSDLAATIYRCLGIDPESYLEAPDNQPIRLVDKGQPIAELF